MPTELTSSVLWLVVPWIVAGVWSGCDLEEQTTDSETVQLAAYFVVTSASIDDESTDIALNQPISVVFNQYLQPDSFQYYNAFTVTSGGIWASGLARYRMFERSLTFYPTRDFRPNLVYSLQVNPDTVRSIGGYPLAVPFSRSFETASSGSVEQNRTTESLSYVASVAPLLEAGCECHYRDDALNPLDYNTLVGRPSTGFVGRLLVLPFEPPHSYLMHKILWDYPDRRFTAMPPPWSDLEPLEPRALEEIELWIWTGARP